LPLLKSITKQVLIGLDYLHTKGKIIHTDLKPENVLLDHIIEPDTSVVSWENLWFENNAQNGNINNGDSFNGPSAVNVNAAIGNADYASTLNPADNSITNRTDVNTVTDSPKHNGMDTESVSVKQPSVKTSVEWKPNPKVSGYKNKKLNVYPRVKVADLGNACWAYKHFTDDIQTRQYRAPEVILGLKWTATVDIWSMACMVFELATGDLLFEPKSGSTHDKNDDHLALMIELLGCMPNRFLQSGKNTRNYFDRQGDLKTISKLEPWALVDVLHEKYRFPAAEAKELSSFLLPMLQYWPDRRATAQECLKHSWLRDVEPL